METVVIAGGTSGMGLATAKLLSAKKYKVIVLGRNEEKLNKAVKEIGDNASGKTVDAANINSLKNLFSEIKTFDHLVVAISGGKGMGNFRDLDLKLLRQGFEEKFFAQLHLLHL